jgi:glycosyltransferase involved in cell wall biosynthesis
MQNMYPNQKRIAIVYDWIDKWGGVERVLLHLHTLFPEAHFFTSIVNLQTAQWAKHLSIQSSFLQSFPRFIRTRRAFLLPLFPLAFESFQFNNYDLVISVTSAFAKFIITKPDTKHICYLLTPPRYLWSHINDYISPIFQLTGKPLLTHLKKWDVYASTRPDGYISLSNVTANRAKEYYNITSPVVHPPFDTYYWDKKKKEMKKPPHIAFLKPYFLWVGRMESYKKPQLVVEVAKKIRSHSFIFVGNGSLEKSLKQGAPQNCQFTGPISDEALSYLYTQADALIMPQNEDFGYVSLEAQYHGCPVIAYGKGGACETVKENISGLFFDEQTVPSLVSKLERFKQISYNLGHSTKLIQKSIEVDFGISRFNTQFIYQLQRFTQI